MRMRGPFDICPSMSWSDSIERQYMGDLVAMHNAGGIDYRLLTGGIEMPLSGQSASDLWLLQNVMGVETLHLPDVPLHLPDVARK